MHQDIIILHLSTTNGDNKGAWQTEVFVILDHFFFLPFYPPNNPQNQNFEKMKAMPGDVILQTCTKNHDHILYCSWDMACDGRIVIFYFGLFFDFLPPLTVQKINIWKKMNKTYRDMIILHKCTKNHNHMLCCSWDMTHDRCNCYFSYWAIFCPYTL